MRLGSIRRGDDRAAVVAVDEELCALVDGYADVAAIFAAGQQGLADARAALAGGSRVPCGPGVLTMPVREPGAVVCVGLNYRSHILEMGRELPRHPTLFSKPARSLTDPHAEIPFPGASDQLDYEAELAIVIGAPGRDVDAEDAWGHVGGFTLLNDITVRDFQRRTLQWYAGKAWQASTPFGPWVVTPDDLPGLDASEIVMRVNGEERQRAAIGDLVFGVAALIADISTIFRLEPGDVIATGTPGGVGAGFDPPVYLSGGDVVEVELDGIGVLRNTIGTRS